MTQIQTTVRILTYGKPRVAHQYGTGTYKIPSTTCSTVRTGIETYQIGSTTQFRKKDSFLPQEEKSKESE